MHTTGAKPAPHRITIVKKPSPPKPKTGHGKTTTVVVTHHDDTDDLSPAGILFLALFFAALAAVLVYLVAKH